MNWDLMEIIDATGATPASLPSRPTVLTGVSTDSRSIRPGELFIALKGERFDGHRFIRDAISRGAAAVLAQEPDPIVHEVPQLFVPDTLTAYGKIAFAYRKRLKTRFIAITGSMGKTTVKEMTGAILARKYRTAKTEMNENNRVGVPKTLLGIDPESERAVIEMGSSIPGEIALLTEIVQPDAALITNTAPVHLERLLSLKGVRIEKSALFWCSPRQALRFVNRDDPGVRDIPIHSAWSIRTFAMESDADVRGIRPVSMGVKGTRFILSTRAAQVEISLPLIGLHHVRNAVTAAAIGVSEGIPLEDIRLALESFQGIEGRLKPVFASPDCLILNDSYNANPVATMLAVRTLAGLASGRTTVALLGDMLELGETAGRYHREVGRECARQKIHFLGLYGAHADDIRKGALDAGFDAEKVFLFETGDDLLRHLSPLLRQPVAILIKGSYALRMGRWVQLILAALNRNEGEA